jgi:hypothetical protein
MAEPDAEGGQLMNKSMLPCDAGIKKRRAVEGQAFFGNNNYINKFTLSNVKNNQIPVKTVLFTIAEIIFFSAIVVFDVVALLGDKQ